MIDVNIGNVITLGLITLAAYAALKFGLKATGQNISWL